MRITRVKPTTYSGSGTQGMRAECYVTLTRAPLALPIKAPMDHINCKDLKKEMMKVTTYV